MCSSQAVYGLHRLCTNLAIFKIQDSRFSHCLKLPAIRLFNSIMLLTVSPCSGELHGHPFHSPSKSKTGVILAQRCAHHLPKPYAHKFPNSSQPPITKNNEAEFPPFVKTHPSSKPITDTHVNHKTHSQTPVHFTPSAPPIAIIPTHSMPLHAQSANQFSSNG